MKRVVLFAAIVAGVLVTIFLVSLGLRVVRSAELEYLLQSETIHSSSNMSLSVIGQLQILRDQLEQRRERVANYTDEARIQTLVSWMPITPASAESDVSLPPLAGFIRRLFGVDPVPEPTPPFLMAMLEEAYYFERIRDFDSALSGYREILGHEPKIPLSETVALHAAFCQLETGDCAGAVDSATQLATEATIQEVRRAAQDLASFTVQLQRVIAGVADHDLPMVERGVHYYFTLQYRETIDLFSRALAKPSDGITEENREMRYYMARAYEAIGSAGEALREYRRLVELCPESRWALESARRTVMLASFYDVDAEGLQSAIAYLTANDDPVLNTLAYQSLYQPAPVPRPDAEEIRRLQLAAIDLMVTSRPDGAAVVINGTPAGRTPLLVTGLSPGVANLRVVSGLESRQEAVVMEAGSVILRSFDMSPTRASLRIETTATLESVSLGETELTIGGELFWDYLPEGRSVLTVVGRRPDAGVFFFETLVNLEKGLTEVTVP